MALRASTAEAPVRLRSSAVHCGLLSGRTKIKADVEAHGAHVRGAYRRGLLPQRRRPGAIGVLAVWRRRRLSKFSLWLLAPTAERASAQRRAVKRHGRWKGADRRRIPLRLSRAPGRIPRHRPTPERWALWIKYGNEPSQRVPPSAGSEGSSQWEQLRVCRSRCLSLASATSAAARDIAADFHIVRESRVERSMLPPSSVGPG